MIEVRPNQKLNKSDFVKFFHPYALKAEEKTGISSIFILSQAAHESGWNAASPNWAMFGIKDNDGLNGNEQLLLTTEYHTTPLIKYPKIVSIVQVGKKLWKYRVYDYFRKYDTPVDSFLDHCEFFLKNKRYKKALDVKSDPVKFAEAIAAAGYATDPLYSNTLKSIINTVKQITKLI